MKEIDRAIMADLLDDLATLCYENARSKGFWESETELVTAISDLPNGEAMGQRIMQLHDIEKVALEHSELSERLERLRKDPNKMDEHCPEFLNLEIEAADLIIRVMDWCGRRNLRIGEAVMAKMKYNATREYKHGKSF